MKIDKKFNTLTKNEYFYFIDHRKKYTDFNTLGLYRSIIENKKLSLADKIEVREFAHKLFQKTFDFLQLKDPLTFVEVSHLGEVLTKGDESMIWDNVRSNQQRILSEKKIKHRNFGEYAKHNCGYEDCVYNGLMIKQGSRLAESEMHFDSDKGSYSKRLKSEKRKADRKNLSQLIDQEIELY